jgi:acyl-CoA thioester hydrolase
MASYAAGVQPPTESRAFDHWTTDTVRFSDQDAVGHINNVAIAAYAETGRVAFGHHLRTARRPEASFVLARLAIDYRAESHYPGEIRVGTRLVRIGTTSFTLDQGIFKDGTCIATAEGVLVHVADGAPATIDGDLLIELESLLAG